MPVSMRISVRAARRAPLAAWPAKKRWRHPLMTCWSRSKRAYYEAHRDEVRDIILTGSEKANKIGNETVKEVKEAMHIYIGD